MPSHISDTRPGMDIDMAGSAIDAETRVREESVAAAAAVRRRNMLERIGFAMAVGEAMVVVAAPSEL